MFSLPRERTWNMIRRVIPSRFRNRIEVKRMTPFLLMELSAFRAWTGVGRHSAGRRCLQTNPQSMQEILAPLSTSARVSTAFKVCKGSMSCIGICIEGVEDTTTAATLGVEVSHIEGDHRSKNPME
jgi:hypothetical protein